MSNSLKGVIPLGAMLMTGLCMLFSSPSSADTSIALGPDSIIALGQGYDADFGRFGPSSCVEGKAYRGSGSRGDITVEFSSGSESELRDARNAAAGGVNVGIVSASRSVEFLSRISSRNLRESVFARVDVDDRPWILGLEADLSGVGRQASHGDDASKRRICGGEFVRQIDVGYRIWIALSMHFDTQDTYEYYKKTTRKSALLGAVKRKQEDVHEIKRFDGKALVSLSVLQEGGDETALKVLLASSDTSCDAGTPEPCLETLDKVLAFVNAPQGAGGLMDQLALDDSLDPLNSRRPAFLRAHTASYESAGLDALSLPPVPDDQRTRLRQALDALQVELDAKLSDLERDEAALRQKGGVLLSHIDVSSARDTEVSVAKLRRTIKTCQNAGTLQICLDAAKQALGH